MSSGVSVLPAVGDLGHIEPGEVEVQPHDFADRRFVLDEQGAASGLRSVGHGPYYPAAGGREMAGGVRRGV